MLAEQPTQLTDPHEGQDAALLAQQPEHVDPAPDDQRARLRDERGALRQWLALGHVSAIGAAPAAFAEEPFARVQRADGVAPAALVREPSQEDSSYEDGTDRDRPGEIGVVRGDIPVAVVPDCCMIAASYGPGGGAGCWLLTSAQRVTRP